MTNNVKTVSRLTEAIKLCVDYSEWPSRSFYSAFIRQPWNIHQLRLAGIKWARLHKSKQRRKLSCRVALVTIPPSPRRFPGQPFPRRKAFPLPSYEKPGGVPYTTVYGIPFIRLSHQQRCQFCWLNRPELYINVSFVKVRCSHFVNLTF